MKSRRFATQRISKLVELRNEEIFDVLQGFHEALINLRYEGRAALAKNLACIEHLLRFVRRNVIKHVEFEEFAAFPFLKTHIPKLEGVIQLLRSEHEDLVWSCQRFEFLIKEFSASAKTKACGRSLEKLEDAGAYLRHLLQSHMRVESQSIYKMAERELHLQEKQGLKKLIAKYNNRRGGG